jgi:hypothetical protein
VTGQSEAAGQLVLVEQDIRHVNQTRKVSPRGRTVSRGISVPRGKIIRGSRSGHVAGQSAVAYQYHVARLSGAAGQDTWQDSQPWRISTTWQDYQGRQVRTLGSF